MYDQTAWRGDGLELFSNEFWDEHVDGSALETFGYLTNTNAQMFSPGPPCTWLSDGMMQPQQGVENVPPAYASIDFENQQFSNSYFPAATTSTDEFFTAPSASLDEVGFSTSQLPSTTAQSSPITPVAQGTLGRCIVPAEGTGGGLHNSQQDPQPSLANSGRSGPPKGGRRRKRSPRPRYGSLRRPFKCQFSARTKNTTCEKSFSCRGHLERHISSKHDDWQMECKIPGCMKRCSRIDNLRDHYWTHVDAGRRGRNSKYSMEELEAILGPHEVRNLRDRLTRATSKSSRCRTKR